MSDHFRRIAIVTGTTSGIGEATARKFVQENFLLNRHLREYLTLMAGVRGGFENHLIAN